MARFTLLDDSMPSGRFTVLEEPPEPTTAGAVLEAGEHSIRGFNRGLVGLATAPYRAIDWVGEKITGKDFLPNAEEMPLYRPFLNQPEPKTTAGRFAASAGEAVGASALPAAGMVSVAPRMAALAPTTAPRAAAQSVGQQIVASPRRAVAADLVSAAGAGVGQQVAEDMGFGPTGQVIGGLVGGFTPLAAGDMVSRVGRATQRAKARSSPYGRIVSQLGDQSIDDLAEGVATGTTRANAVLNRRALDYLGQEMVTARGNRQQAVQNTIDRLVRDGVSPTAARDHVRRVIGTHRDSELFFGEYPTVSSSNQETRLARSATDEAAGRIEDSGVHWLTDTIANAGTGASSSRIRNSIMNRLPALREQMREGLLRMSPNQQTIQDADDLVENMVRQAQREYDAVYNAPGGTAVNYPLLHGLLSRVVDRHLMQMRGRGDDHADALREAIDRLFTRVPVNPATREQIPLLEDRLAAARNAVREARRQRAPKEQVDQISRQADALAEELRLARRDVRPAEDRIIMPSLRQLQDMRTGIRGQRDAARQSGRDDIARILQALYRDITRVMERASPQWARANRRWADMDIAEKARELGEAFSDRAGPKFRQQMREFEQLAPEAQDMVRIEFVQKLLDKIDNAGDTHDLAKLFSTPHMRSMVRTLLGDQAAVDLARLIRDNQVATKSKNMLGGSPTQPREQRQAEHDADIGLLAAAETASPANWRKWLIDYTMQRLREKRNRRIADVITTPMRDVPEVARHLEQMRRAQSRINQLTNPRAPTRERTLPSRFFAQVPALEEE